MLKTPSHLLIAFLLTLISITQALSSQHHCSNPIRAPEVRAGFWLPQFTPYFPVSHINTSLYTHIYYSLSLTDADLHGSSFPPADELPLIAAFAVTLKSRNSSLNTILSISTTSLQSNSSATFASMASSVLNRAAFIKSAIEMARTHAFDGLDLAWQFPSSQSDMGNLGFLLQEWREKINEEATGSDNSSKPLLLTATVYFSDHLFDGSAENLDYPVGAISNSLDWVNALCFSYHKNGMVTGSDAALYDVASHFSTSYGITSWLDSGLPPCKLVMGVPLYGRSWFLKNKAKNGIGAQAVAAGPRQKRSNQTGIMAFFEIEEFLRNNVTNVLTYDSRTVSSYFHNGNVWVSFDSPDVVEEKIAYASQRRLLGYFLWPINFDTGNYTISRTASDVWLRYKASTEADNEGGSNQDPSPIDLPPQLLSPPKSTVMSSSIRGTSEMNILHLHCSLALVLIVVSATFFVPF